MAERRCYPNDLAARVRDSWPVDALPLPARLEAILDTMFHASFLRDEERPVTCRLLCLDPSVLPIDQGPPTGLQPLAFSATRAFDEHELRRLSPAAKYHRALIGVREAGDGIETWGIVQSGPRWLQSAHGGRSAETQMPAALVVRAVRPGHLAVSCGHRPIAELRGGRLTDFALDVFQSEWLQRVFRPEKVVDGKDLEHTLIETFGRMSVEITSGLDEATELMRFVAQQMLKRLIATMRASHHGGLLVVLPGGCVVSSYLSLKYAIADDEPRRRFRRLALAIVKEVERHRAEGDVPLASYRLAFDDRLAELDEALFELSHLIGALADVDGAVVLTKRFEVLGFGAEILGALSPVGTVRRALDLEGTQSVEESGDRVGTRHRSAYRLCAAVPGSLALVVSQDGNVRFVTMREGAVTYWDHGAGDE